MVSASRVLPALLLLLAASRPAAAQQKPRNSFRLEAGKAEIHSASNTGGMLGLRFARRLGDGGVVRTELGASYSSADENYFALDAGAEVRPLARYRVTPALGVGAGFIVEPEFRGELLRGTVALDTELSAHLALRIGAQLGYHGGERGPHSLFLGVEIAR